MKKLDVVFYEVFKEEGRALKKILPKNIRAIFVPHTIQASKHKFPPAALISIRTQSVIPKAWTASLSGILTRSQGYDHLEKFLKTNKAKTLCGYLEPYSSRAVAEQAILMALALMRKFKQQLKQFDRFDRDGLTGLECRGKNALVIGVGSIGEEIVDAAKGLRFKVKGVDIVRRMRGLEYVPLKNGVRRADVVFCALPLTKQTKGLLDYDLLKSVRPGTIFVNISRAEVSPVRDLRRLLDQNILGGLGLDVYPNESELGDFLRGKKRNLGPDEKTVLALKDRSNVLFTPHNAFNSQESLDGKARLTAEAVVAFLKSGKFPTPVSNQ